MRDVGILPQGKGLEEKKDCVWPCKSATSSLDVTSPSHPQIPSRTPRVLHQAAFEEGRGWHIGNIRQRNGQREGKLRLPKAVCVVSGAEQMSSPRTGTKADAVICRIFVCDSEPCADGAKMKRIWKQFECCLLSEGPRGWG